MNISVIQGIAQSISEILIVLAMYFTIKRTMINKKWIDDGPILLLMLHIFVYYFAYFILKYLQPNDFNIGLIFTTWSTLLRLHEVCVLLILSIVNNIKERIKWGK
jgi:hypothetical protein